MTPVPKMVVSIRDLRRSTLQETYLNLETWLEKTKNDDRSRRAIVADNDSDAFDQSIKLIIIDRAQMHEELAKCLFSLDCGTVKRATRCPWFFKSTPNLFFIEKLFPVVSVSTRLKVITALAKYVEENRAEELYGFVRSQYGFRVAQPFIAKCPNNRVRQVLIVENRLVKPSTLLAVCRRFPDLGIEVLKSWLQKERTVPSCIGKFLIRNNPEFISQFTFKQLRILEIQMGRKLSRSQMKTNGETIMGYGWDANQMLKGSGHFLRYFTKNAQVEALVGFVNGSANGHLTLNTWKECLSSIRGQIQSFRSKSREILLENVFRSLFNAELWETPEAFSKTLLEIVSPEKRLMLLEYSECQGDDFIYLNPPVVAVPKLMALVKRTPESSDRARLIKNMIESCRLAWDLEQLERVCVYAEKHIKNEVSTLAQVVSTVLTQFATPRLPREVWSFLSRMASFLLTEGQREISLLICHEGMMAHSLTYGEAVGPLLQAWVKDLGLILASIPWENVPILQRPNFTHSKELLRLIYPFIPNLAGNIRDDSQYNAVVSGYLDSASSACFKLSDLPDKGELLANLLVKLYPGKHILGEAYRQQLYQFPCLLEHFSRESFLLKSLLKVSPELVVDNLAIIVSKMFLSTSSHNFKHFDSFLTSKKLLDFFQLPPRIAAQCRDAFSVTTDESSINCILYVFSHVASMSDFEKLAKPYITSNPKLDMSDPKSAIIRCVPRMLRNIHPLHEALPLILPCLVGGGDLLYQALPAFQAFCYTQPVESVVQVLIPYFDAPVSIKKKALRILAEVCSLYVSFSYFKTLWSQTKHYSARLVLLDCIAHSFIENPVQETWDCLKACILEADVSCLASFPYVADIPDSYFSDFMKIVWNVLLTMEQISAVTYAQKELLEQAIHRIELLQGDFCQNVIALQLFTDHSVVNFFTIQYLIKGCIIVDSSEKLKFIATLLEERSHSHSKAVTIFVKEFCNSRSEVGFRDVYKDFMSLCGHFFQHPTFMEASLFLKYVELCEIAKQDSCYDNEVQLLPVIGNSIAEHWLTIPDYTFMVPFFVSSVSEFFEYQYDIRPLLVGILRDEPVIALAVLESLPKNHWFTPSLVKLSDVTDSIKWPYDLSKQCHQNILSFVDKLPYAAVQQALHCIVREKNFLD